MKTKILASVLLAAGLLAFGMSAGAQRDQGQQGQAGQDQSKPGMMNGGMMGMMGGNMMGGGTTGMTGMMSQMTAHHEQMSTLMNKLMQSMAAIQNEKDPAALQSKLAEHQALLNEMRGQMMQQGNMMQMMSGQMMQNAPVAGDAAKPPAK